MKPFLPYHFSTAFTNGRLLCALCKAMVIICLFIFPVAAQSQFIDKFGSEEVSIGLNVPRMGLKEIPGIVQGNILYLSVTDVFDYLEIKNINSSQFDSVSGFFIHPLSTYLIDRVNNYIVYEGIVYNLKKNDLLKIETGLYLKSDYFGEIFGLFMDFNFRSLSVNLDTKVELPAIKKMQQELMRQNLAALKNEKVADTTLARSKGLFNVGMVDWAVVSEQQSNARGNTRLNLDIGTRFAGGEANLSLQHNTSTPFTTRQQSFRWRMVNNKSNLFKQITVGRIAPQATSTIFGPLTGVTISNTPTNQRRSFGSYRYTNKTEPGWTVELYLNNVLIDYTKADASGFFTFNVPLVYGNTVLTLRAYGPFGEERVREEAFSIPFNFLPVNTFEYTLSAGVVEDDVKTKFSRANVNYGLMKRLTIGAGVEYLSTALPAKVMPFVNASLRLGSRVLVNADHIAGVRSKAFMSVRLPSNLQLEMNYVKYEKGQTAILINFAEERKAMLSYFFRKGKLGGFSKLSVNQLILPKYNLLLGEFTVSAMLGPVSTNLTTTANIVNSSNAVLLSNLTMAFRLPAGIRLTPQLRYDYLARKVNFFGGDVEKRISKLAVVNFSYQRNFFDVAPVYLLGLRYNFSVANVGVSVNQSRFGTATTEFARGSITYDAHNQKAKFNDQVNVGRGGIVVAPFIDINNNGKREKGEPAAEGLKLFIRGGRMEQDDKDTTIRISGLEAFNDYMIELNKSSFDNISWQITKANIKVTVEPNHFRLVEVPVSVMGEVSGTVILDKKRNGRAGIGRMYVNIYKNDTTLVAKTLTEPDGYFSYLGLLPGDYTASIDTAQMAKLNFCCQENRSFSIKSSFDGDVVDGLSFVITSDDTIPPVVFVYTPPVQKADTVASEPVKKVKAPNYVVLGYLPPKQTGKKDGESVRTKRVNGESLNKSTINGNIVGNNSSRSRKLSNTGFNTTVKNIGGVTNQSTNTVNGKGESMQQAEQRKQNSSTSRDLELQRRRRAMQAIELIRGTSAIRANVNSENGRSFKNVTSANKQNAAGTNAGQSPVQNEAARRRNQDVAGSSNQYGSSKESKPSTTSAKNSSSNNGALNSGIQQRNTTATNQQQNRLIQNNQASELQRRARQVIDLIGGALSGNRPVPTNDNSPRRQLNSTTNRATDNQQDGRLNGSNKANATHNQTQASNTITSAKKQQGVQQPTQSQGASGNDGYSSAYTSTNKSNNATTPNASNSNNNEGTNRLGSKKKDGRYSVTNNRNKPVQSTDAYTSGYINTGNQSAVNQKQEKGNGANNRQAQVDQKAGNTLLPYTALNANNKTTTSSLSGKNAPQTASQQKEAMRQRAMQALKLLNSTSTPSFSNSQPLKEGITPINLSKADENLLNMQQQNREQKKRIGTQKGKQQDR